MKWMSLSVVALALAGCREVGPYSPNSSSSFHGYQLQGNVVTQSGFPLQGVELEVFYDFRSGYPAQDTTAIPVPDSTDTIEVSVFSDDGILVKTFVLPPVYTTLPRNIWNENDSSGVPVKSGAYFIRVYFDGAFARQYQWLVDGHVTAVTDDQGQFVITKLSLPIGIVCDLYDSAGTYRETAQITEEIFIRATRQGTVRTGYVTLAKDQITQITIVM